MDGSGTLVVIGIAAFILPALAGWIRVPAVVLEILFGVIVGPVLGLVHGTELLDQIAELGLLMLMFLAGFEIDFAALRRGGAGPILQALAVFCGTLALSFLATAWLDLALFYAPVLATTSAALVLPSLRSAGITSRSLGQAILVAAVIADLVTLLLVAEITIWARDGWGVELIGGPALLVAVVLVLQAMKLILWWHPRKAARLFRRDDPEEMGIRGALALLAVFVGLSAALDVEPLLAAFPGGGRLRPALPAAGGPSQSAFRHLLGLPDSRLLHQCGPPLRGGGAPRPRGAGAGRGHHRRGVPRQVPPGAPVPVLGLFAARGGGRRIAAVGPAQPRGGGGGRWGSNWASSPPRTAPSAVLIAAVTSITCRLLFRRVITSGSASKPEDGVGAAAPRPARLAQQPVDKAGWQLIGHDIPAERFALRCESVGIRPVCLPSRALSAGRPAGLGARPALSTDCQGGSVP